MISCKIRDSIGSDTPLLLVCLFCMNVFYGKRGEVKVDPVLFPMVNKPCPICDSQLQLWGLHPGAWGGIRVEGEPEPVTPS